MNWQRRARPLLGTLVEIGVPAGHEGTAGFMALQAVQGRLSRFDTDSDVARFAALPVGGHVVVHADTAAVLTLAGQLHSLTDGAFDVTLGSGAMAWRLEGQRLHKLQPGVTFDLGGIGKGHAVDRAVAALQAAGIDRGWVNAGGDLRVFGPLELPVRLRHEETGGASTFVQLGDGALATSHYGTGCRCQLHGTGRHAHVSVAAPTCAWADALTKVAALLGDAAAGLLDDAGATAWWH